MPQGKERSSATTFYILILTQAFSMIGSRISSLAVGIHVFNETGSATPLALVAFFAIVPMVLASGVSGVLADRWDRRLVMVLADAGQAVGTLLLLISFASDGFQLWHLYAVTVIQAIFGVFQGPAFTASVTMLIPDEGRDRANALMQLTQPSAGVLAPVIAGVVFAAVGVVGTILIDLVTFLVAMVVVFSVHIPRPTVTEEGIASRGTLWKEAFYGLRYLLQRRVMFYMVLYAAFVNFLLSGVMVLSTPYLLGRTGSETTLGLLLSVINAGAVAGGIIYGIWGGTRPRIYTILPGVMVMGVALALAGTAQTALLLGATLLLMLLPMPMVNAALTSIMQAKVAPDVQGRVFAVLGQISMILTPIAYLLAGPLADRVFEPAVGGSGWSSFAPLVGTGTGAGIGLMMVIAGVGTVAISAGMLAWPMMRNMERDLPDYVPAATVSGAAAPDAPLLDEDAPPVAPVPSGD